MRADQSTPDEGVATDLSIHERQFVAFDIGDQRYAVPMAPVQEIIRVPDVARLPLAPPALDGLANLRGRVLPIVDLRRVFGLPTRAHDDGTRAVVIRLGQPLGFVVDRVASVISVEPGEIEPARSVQDIVQSDYLSGVIRRRDYDAAGMSMDRLLPIIDFARLVADQFARLAADDAAHVAGDDGHLGAATDAAAVASADELRLVSFTVHGQEYAIDIAGVQEIVQVPPNVAALPNSPSHVLGLFTLRERLLPLVSLRMLFGLPHEAAGEHHRIVVAALPGGNLVGLLTDTVKEVLSVPRQQAEAMPGLLAKDGSLQEFESICRLDGGRRLVSVVATDRLLRMQGIQDALAAAAGGASDTDEGTTMASDDAAPGANDGDDLQVVVFRLGAEEFGAPIMSVQEIVRVPESLTRVPRAPDFVEGMINLRGTVLPVIDQRRRFGLAPIERNDRQRIMVYTLAGTRTGFIVDSVAEVLRIPRGRVERAPALSADEDRLVTEVARLDAAGRLVMLVDPERLLAAGEAGVVQQLADDAQGPGGASADADDALRAAA